MFDDNCAPLRLISTLHAILSESGRFALHQNNYDR